MKVYGIQFDSEWENKNKNYELVSTLLQDIEIEKNSLLILPEMFATGFSLNIEVTAKNEPKKTETYLSKLARDKHSWVVAGMVYPSENENKGINCSVIFSPCGKKISANSKILPIPMLGENKVHLSGSKIECHTIESFNVTALICYDLRFPEFFRTALSSGTDVFVVIACWPEVRKNHWIQLIQARAIENQAYVIGVNRVGADKGLKYCGHSLVVDPVGNILANGGSDEMVVEAEIDKTIIGSWRNEFPVIECINNHPFTNSQSIE